MNDKDMHETTLPLWEALVKTSYQTQITHPSDKNCENPIGFGSGFIVEYNNNVFFVTADHVVHPDDYDCKERTGTDFVVSIFNNVKPESNFLSTIVTPLGGFYYMEKFDLDKPHEALKLHDVTVCIMKEKHFEYRFLTNEVRFISLTINAGDPKFRIPSDLFAEPSKDKLYFVYGKIRTKLVGIILHSEDTLKEGLKFMDNSGDYYLLNTPDVINDYEDWAGLSGSPVISETGECIGVLCSVNVNTKSIWVMPISQVKMLMDIAISQEEILSLKDKQMKENKRKGSSSEELLDKEIILDELRITTGQTILEIGCGNGYMSKEFSKLVGEKGKVYAVDIQIELIDKLKKEISETNIIPLLSDITKDKIEVNDNSIDLIYLATVFHIFSNEQIEVFQKEVNRLLKVGGKLVILNIDKKESSFGPPQNMRVSNEELNHIIKMKPVISVKLGESFYMQIFEKIDKN